MGTFDAFCLSFCAVSCRLLCGAPFWFCFFFCVCGCGVIGASFEGGVCVCGCGVVPGCLFSSLSPPLLCPAPVPLGLLASGLGFLFLSSSFSLFGGCLFLLGFVFCPFLPFFPAAVHSVSCSFPLGVVCFFGFGFLSPPPPSFPLLSLSCVLFLSPSFSVLARCPPSVGF